MSNTSIDIKTGVNSDQENSEQHLARPPIVYSSVGDFAKSIGARWRSLWTRRFILSLAAGQVVSLCITCTNVTTTELVSRNWTLSTTQGIFLSVLPVSPRKIRSDRYQILYVVPYLYAIHDISMYVCLLCI